jgi:hypothetical protein
MCIYIYVYGDASRHTYTCLVLNSCLYWKKCRVGRYDNSESNFYYLVASDIHNMKKRCWQHMQQILYLHCDSQCGILLDRKAEGGWEDLGKWRSNEGCWRSSAETKPSFIHASVHTVNRSKKGYKDNQYNKWENDPRNSSAICYRDFNVEWKLWT